MSYKFPQRLKLSSFLARYDLMPLHKDQSAVLLLCFDASFWFSFNIRQLCRCYERDPALLVVMSCIKYNALLFLPMQRIQRNPSVQYTLTSTYSAFAGDAALHNCCCMTCQDLLLHMVALHALCLADQCQHKTGHNCTV